MSKPKVYRQNTVVNKGHLDELNHVNNVQYLQWIQDVAKAHWLEAARPEWLEKYAWVALNHFIEYKKPAFLEDELLIQTHVHEFTGAKSHRFVRITNVKSGDLIVQSSTWWCMIDKETNKPARLPTEMLDSFEAPE